MQKALRFMLKFSHSIVFGEGLRKTAARTLLFLSEAVSGKRGGLKRPGGVTEKEPLKASFVWGKKQNPYLNSKT